MPKEIHKIVKPDEKTTVDKIDVETILIDPRLSIPKLLEKIHEEEQKDKIKLLKIGFEAGIQTKDDTTIGFGKDNKFIIKESGTAVNVPPRVIKLTDDYTIEDLIEAVDEYEEYRKKHEHDYTLNTYPILLDFLDIDQTPDDPNYLIRFRKERHVSKDSDIGMMLSGAQTKPLDAVILYTVKKNKKTGNYVSKKIPPHIKKDMEHYDLGDYVLKADDVQNYTINIYNASFIVKRTCLVGKETRTIERFYPINGSKCKLIPK